MSITEQNEAHSFMQPTMMHEAGEMYAINLFLFFFINHFIHLIFFEKYYQFVSNTTYI